MRGQLRIDSVYAFVLVDTDGTEGIPAMPGPGGMQLPMVGADMERMESLRPVAAQVAERLGKPVEMVRFTKRQHLAWLRAGDDVPAPTPKKPAERIPFRTFHQPVMSTDKMIHADGVIVSAVVIDGKPGVAVIYRVDGDDIPVALTGQQAADLVPLVADAWEAAKALES